MNRFFMLNWTLEYDDKDNAWYEAASAIGCPDDGPFHWRIKPKYEGGSVGWFVYPDAELGSPKDWDIGYCDPMEAAIVIQVIEDGFVEQAKAEWDALPQEERDRLAKEYS